ncbi:sulfatase family protein [Gimesia maris]|uniref:sulfatase family protein n=1 Tax=Gimesia maris TaxID=122 RepID=UPI0012B825DF
MPRLPTLSHQRQDKDTAVKRLLTLLCLAGLIVTPALQSASAAPQQKKPNFIVIFCDNLGYGDIEPFGSTVNRTPCLNRMAREGRKFTHYCVTAGVCTPSRASIMTGCYSQRVGMHWNPRDGQVLRPISPYGLNPDEITVAEVLKKQGYKTGMIGKWHLGDQTPFLPTRQGFDYFYGIPYSDDMTQAVGQRLGDRLDGKNWPPLPVMLNDTVIEAGVDRNLLTKDYTEKAVEFIEKNQDQPFFLYFPQAMPGSTRKPFASDAFRGKSKNGPWGDSIEELDWSTGQILDKLVELGIDKNTLVIWTSDNGSPMAKDMNSTERGTNKPLNGRGYTTSEGAFRVPTIVWWPETVPAGTVCEELATTMDLLPTFARLAGGKVPSDRIIDGHDIRPLIMGEADAKTPYDGFYYYAMEQLQAVRKGPWKLFVPLKEFSRHPHFKKGEGSRPLLFNVVTDISSEHNVADQHPEIVKELMSLAEKARADLGDTNHPGANQRPAARVDHPVPPTLKTTSTN